MNFYCSKKYFLFWKFWLHSMRSVRLFNFFWFRIDFVNRVFWSLWGEWSQISNWYLLIFGHLPVLYMKPENIESILFLLVYSHKYISTHLVTVKVISKGIFYYLINFDCMISILMQYYNQKSFEINLNNFYFKY